MSRELDRRYAYVWEPFALALIVIVVMATIVFHLRSEVRNLQRRVAVLEQRQ